MKRTTLTYLCCFCLLIFPHLNQAQSAYAPDELIVQFEPGTTQIEIQAFLNAFHLILVDGPTPILEFYLLKVDENLGFPDWIDYNNFIDPINGLIVTGQTNSNVKGIGLNHSTSIPQNMSEGSVPTPVYNGPLASCGGVFNINTNSVGSTNLKAGMTDTGITQHPLLIDFFEMADIGYNFILDNSRPRDDNSHGTHITSSIVLETPTNTSSKIGLKSYKTHDQNGLGTIWYLIEAIDESLASGDKVMNMSLSYEANYDHRFDQYAPLRIAIEDAADLNSTLFVTAAGNNGWDIDLPGAFANYPTAFPSDNILSVTAVNCEQSLPDWANSGEISVDIAALGVDVWGINKELLFVKMSGTSHATAFVSRVAALLGTFQAVFDYEKVKCAIIKGATTSNILTNEVLSNGYLDSENALDELLGGASCTFNGAITSFPGTSFPVDKMANIQLKYNIDGNGQLNIQSDQEQLAVITIVNTLGQVISQEQIQLYPGTINHEVRVAKQLIPSVYFAHLLYGKERKVIKFVR